MAEQFHIVIMYVYNFCQATEGVFDHHQERGGMIMMRILIREVKPKWVVCQENTGMRTTRSPKKIILFHLVSCVCKLCFSEYLCGSLSSRSGHNQRANGGVRKRSGEQFLERKL